MSYTGRRKIFTDTFEITEDNVMDVLDKAMQTHEVNRVEIEYLYNYYKGVHPILQRTKEVRPELTHNVPVNIAQEIVDFKDGYVLGKPIQYILRNEEEQSDSVNTLNDYMYSEMKNELDHQMLRWMLIGGVGVRMVLPDRETVLEEDEAPFEIYCLDPRNAFVIYANDLGEEPVMGVKYIVKDDPIGTVVFSCYTKNAYYEIVKGDINQNTVNGITAIKKHSMRDIPIIEYPLNNDRMGAFESCLDLLDAFDLITTCRVESTDQFVQSLMVFYNVDIDNDQFTALREQGAIVLPPGDASFQPDVKYLVSELNQSQQQTLLDSLYDNIMSIVGIPNEKTTSTGGDTGSAVILRDGWSKAEAFAQNTEMMFKMSERKFLKIISRICDVYGNLKIKPSSIEPQFTRRNYEAIATKSQVLISMLPEGFMLDPRLAFQYCGMFTDPESAYTMSEKYTEEKQKEAEEKARELAEQTAETQEESDNDEETPIASND